MFIKKKNNRLIITIIVLSLKSVLLFHENKNEFTMLVILKIEIL